MSEYCTLFVPHVPKLNKIKSCYFMYRKITIGNHRQQKEGKTQYY